MPDKLPKGWVKTTLGEVCSKPQYGWTTSGAREGKLHLLRTTDITSGRIDWETVPFCRDEPPEPDHYLLKDGDIVISRAGSVGYGVRVTSPPKSVFASYLIRFRPAEEMNGEFVAYFLQSPSYWTQVRASAAGIAMLNVNASKLEGFGFLVPPAREQERIVAKLDALLSRVAAGETATRRALARLQRYRASVLEAAVTGELTRDWRKTQKPGETGPQLLKRMLKVRRGRFELGWLIDKLTLFLGDLKKGKRLRSNISVLEDFLHRLSSFRDKVQTSSSWNGDWDKQWNEFKSIKLDLPEKTHERSSNEGGVQRFRRGFGYLQSGHWKSEFYSEPTKPELTELPTLPRNWVWASVDQMAAHEPRAITDGPFGSNLKSSHYTKSGPRVIRLQNIGDGVFIDEKAHISRKHYEFLKDYAVYPGDLVIRALGIPAPRACRIPDIGPAIVKADCIRFKIADDFIDPNFVLYALNSPATQHRTEKKVHGVGRPRLNLGEIKSIALPLPPRSEQKQIAREVERRLTAGDRLTATLNRQLERATATRQSLLREAFAGGLVPQDPNDESASVLLDRIRAARQAQAEIQKKRERSRRGERRRQERKAPMTQNVPTPATLRTAWDRIHKKPDARRLFQAAGYGADQVVQFYETLRATPEVRKAFEAASKTKSRVRKAETTSPEDKTSKGYFRLGTLWLENFKNLKNYRVNFNPSKGLDVVLGWNGTGKSNLFEALVLIFRNLHYWWEKNQWSAEALSGFQITYEIEEQLVEITWTPGKMKRPEARRAVVSKQKGTDMKFEAVRRVDLPLPRFVFGYYSGPTNRLAEHFLPMKRDHYERLRKANSDDPKTLAKLLKQRRFFCAEAHHAKYVLLAFAYKEDRKITEFLERRLRIVGFESALFIIRRPQWGHGGTSKDFWGATGIMLRVMEKLRRFAVAPMVVKQSVSDGYRTRREDHYYFFLPDLESLRAFAAEYTDARSFFLALESTDFSELIHDVKIQVRVKAAPDDQVSITFRELSEGEQQLLVVLGLMRFTKSHQSLILLDEPDTHLNPQWSIEYLKDLASVISDDEKPSPEQQTSQQLTATHDPLVIASLLKDQVHLLKRDRDSLQCYSQQASEDPRGLGFTGILLSDMFGFQSDLDEETLSLLDRQVQLAGKRKKLATAEKNELTALNKQIEALGFKTVSSDPYYRAFIEALTRRQEALTLIQKPIQTPQERATIRKAADEILAGLAEKHELKA